MINNQDERNFSGRTKEEDGEIGVFGAEKYFNGGIDNNIDSPKITKIDTTKLESVKDEESINQEPIVKPVTIHQPTPSVPSESSWHSHKALLQNVMKNPPPQKASKMNGKSFLSGLVGCNCYCFDKDSVDTEEIQVGEISFKRPPNGEVIKSKQNKTDAASKTSLVNKPSSAEPWLKEDLFTFPTMNSNVGIRPLKLPLVQGGDVDEIGRKSLEVFGTPVLPRRNKSLNLERRLKSWEPSSKVEEDVQILKGNYDDNESDASSDLFEIESLTGKANPFLVGQVSDVASGCVTPTTCYPPSEASIEWSVVTASAADFSVMSNYEDPRPSITLPSPSKTFSKTSTITTSVEVKDNKEFQSQRRRSSGLFGCNSQKAVKVAGDAHKTNDKTGFDPRMRRVSDSYMPAARFRAENKFASFEPSQTPRLLASTHSLPHSHSPQASRILYIQ